MGALSFHPTTHLLSISNHNEIPMWVTREQGSSPPSSDKQFGKEKVPDTLTLPSPRITQGIEATSKQKADPRRLLLTEVPPTTFMIHTDTEVKQRSSPMVMVQLFGPQGRFDDAIVMQLFSSIESKLLNQKCKNFTFCYVVMSTAGILHSDPSPQPNLNTRNGSWWGDSVFSWDNW